MIKNLFKYFILLIILLLIGCNETINDSLIGNQSPETHLFLNPDGEISQQKSKLKVHWWGDDKDGLVVGFMLQWEGIDNQWSFTKSNDSIFALPIGTVDTSFTFKVASVDNSGNGEYDNSIIVNGIDFGNEPFTDQNGNNQYDIGEPFIDLGAIDETPAKQNFPIKNSSPIITWNDLSILPEFSFPVITVGWDAFDLDGNETISEIHLALNDTSNFIKLSGSTRLVSLIINDLDAIEPEMNVFINADQNKKLAEKLTNLQLNNTNRLYIRGSDNSGSTSKFLPLPDTGRTWYVSKPRGDLLIIDDYNGGNDVENFYNEKFDVITNSQYDVLDIENTSYPYESVTFQNVINLFKYIYWYSSSNPSIDLTNLVTQNYIQNGGKIAFSMTFQDSSANFEFSSQVIQTFLPIESFDQAKPISFMFAGANIVPSTQFSSYPTLSTQSTIGSVRTFKISEITSSRVYSLTSSQVNGDIALINNTKNLFFIGLPLHHCDANGNVSDLLQQVFNNEFGLNK